MLIWQLAARRLIFDGIASIHQNSKIKKNFTIGNNGCLTALFFSALFCFTKIKGQIATLYSVLLGNCLPISTQMPMCYSFWFLKQFVPIKCHPWSSKLVHFYWLCRNVSPFGQREEPKMIRILHMYVCCIIVLEYLAILPFRNNLNSSVNMNQNTCNLNWQDNG